MNKEIKAQWLDALRSGKYVQTTGVLRQDHTNEMCCLGVLADVIAPQDWDGQGFHDNEMQLPSNRICDLAGLGSPRREVPPFWHIPEDEPVVNRLASLNDSSENFDAVIEMIENEL